MSERETLLGVLKAWLDDLHQRPPQEWSAVDLSRRPAWGQVRAVVAGLAPYSRRPDLYGKDGSALDDRVLITLSGLGQVAEAAATGTPVSLEDLAADFTAFCRAAAPEAQSWILLDIDLPSGTDLTLGEYRLQAASATSLAELMPLRSMRRFIRSPDLDPDTLGGSTFLQQRLPGQALARGRSWLPDLDQRPERRHLDPLLVLQLWNVEESVHPEAYFHVEPGRHSEIRSGSPHIEPSFDHAGEEVGEMHRAFGYRVPPSELPTFAAFLQEVQDMISSVRSRTTKNGRPATTARALASAANRLVRAAQRTMGGTYVDESEADDVLLDYVIAMEAVMAADGRGDSRRRTAQRSAAMWTQDEDRLAVYQTVKNAYTRRSQYAHGEDQQPISDDELFIVRRTAFGVFLRWLVLTSDLNEAVLQRLDESLVSHRERCRITQTLDTFFTATPAAPEV
ncbi:hypothetical protein AB0912_11380 [Streptomyces sp. NPDC007084]|uniref:hypothetical protein n=1 Tax=Streptomyces sp. NPDC007084 TaxID=3154313 RepID=UPI00345193E7